MFSPWDVTVSYKLRNVGGCRPCLWFYCICIHYFLQLKCYNNFRHLLCILFILSQPDHLRRGCCTPSATNCTTYKKSLLAYHSICLECLPPPPPHTLVYIKYLPSSSNTEKPSVLQSIPSVSATGPVMCCQCFNKGLPQKCSP